MGVLAHIVGGVCRPSLKTLTPFQTRNATFYTLTKLLRIEPGAGVLAHIVGGVCRPSLKTLTPFQTRNATFYTLTKLLRIEPGAGVLAHIVGGVYRPSLKTLTPFQTRNPTFYTLTKLLRIEPGVGVLAHIVGWGVPPKPQSSNSISDTKSNFLHPNQTFKNRTRGGPCTFTYLGWGCTAQALKPQLHFRPENTIFSNLRQTRHRCIIAVYHHLLYYHYQTTYFCVNNVRRIYILINWLGLKGFTGTKIYTNLQSLHAKANPNLINYNIFCVFLFHIFSYGYFLLVKRSLHREDLKAEITYRDGYDSMTIRNSLRGIFERNR